MIVVSGSWLVRDSDGHDDVDVIYLTWDLGRYVMLLLRKTRIEAKLREIVGVKVSFSPYLLASPTIVGNLFLAITLLRYPLRKKYLESVLKLTLSKRDKRWLLLHFAFALLGLLSAKTSRDYIKCCSMIAENLLYIERSKIPNSWRHTIKLGYAVASRRGLRSISKLLLSCFKNNNRIKECSVESKLLKGAAVDYLRFTEIGELGELRDYIGEAFRKLHEIIARQVLGYSSGWRKCSSIVINLVDPRVLVHVISDPSVRASTINVFVKCRYRIPVLSPLAHP